MHQESQEIKRSAHHPNRAGPICFFDGVGTIRYTLWSDGRSRVFLEWNLVTHSHIAEDTTMAPWPVVRENTSPAPKTRSQREETPDATMGSKASVAFLHANPLVKVEISRDGRKTTTKEMDLVRKHEASEAVAWLGVEPATNYVRHMIGNGCGIWQCYLCGEKCWLGALNKTFCNSGETSPDSAGISSKQAQSDLQQLWG